MRLLILGDLHAKWQDLNSVMKNVDFGLKIPYDAVIQVGDFGFYPQTFIKLDEFHRTIKRKSNPMEGYTYDYKPLKFHKPVHAISGNHENHSWLKKNQPEWNNWKEKYNIIYQSRGSYIDIDGYKIGFIGGALNADRPQEGSIDKETTNYILDKEINRTLDSWNSIGGMDTIISHSCPTKIGIGMEGAPSLYMAVQNYIVQAGYGENNFYDCGEHTLTRLYKGLIRKPDMQFFGHFHTSKNIKVDNTEFICVGSTDSSDNKCYVKPFILNTKTKTYDYYDKMALNFDGEHRTFLADKP